MRSIVMAGTAARSWLGAVWVEPRPASTLPRRWYDWTLVAGLAAVALLEGVLRPDLPWRAVSVAVTAGLTPALLWRRSRPLLMVTVVFGTCAVVTALSRGAAIQSDAIGYVVLLPYWLFRWGSGREAAAGLAVLLAKGAIALTFGSASLGTAEAGAALLLTSAALGAAVRYRALARARDLDRVRTLERESLARDLHDVVAHHISAIAVRAQAGLATSSSRPDAAEDALRLIEMEASRALTEMRSLVRVLRRGGVAEPAAGLRLTDLEKLAGGAPPGPAVEVEIQGDLEDLSPSVTAAVYRLAQESITNARRHARHASRIHVRLAVDDTSVHLRVNDDGDGPSRPRVSSGYGLVGMLERADLLGGTCQAGPDPDRGWTVDAVLPREGPAA